MPTVKLVLVFSHDEVVHGKGSMMGKMPGETSGKESRKSARCVRLYDVPSGQELLFMGQDFGQIDEWNEKLLWNGNFCSILFTKICRAM